MVCVVRGVSGASGDSSGVSVVGVQTEETGGAGRRAEYCRAAMAGRH